MFFLVALFSALSFTQMSEVTKCGVLVAGKTRNPGLPLEKAYFVRSYNFHSYDTRPGAEIGIAKLLPDSQRNYLDQLLSRAENSPKNAEVCVKGQYQRGFFIGEIKLTNGQLISPIVEKSIEEEVKDERLLKEFLEKQEVSFTGWDDEYETTVSGLLGATRSAEYYRDGELIGSSFHVRFFLDISSNHPNHEDTSGMASCLFYQEKKQGRLVLEFADCEIEFDDH